MIIRMALAVLLVAALAACRPTAPADDAAIDSAPPSDSAAEALNAPPVLQHPGIGGDFELVDHTGATFRLADHRGELFVMFFGYTACPDYCPQTLSLLGRAYEQLGERSDQVTTLFVSLDTQRDTPEKLAEYLGYFDLQAVGLTGSREAIDLLVPQYAGRYEIEQPDPASGPLFGHTTYIYLIDQRGHVRYTFRPSDTASFIADGIRQLLEG